MTGAPRPGTDGRPLGELVEWHGARPPRREPLQGERVVLEPLDPDVHAAPLYRASADREADWLWDYMSNGPFSAEAEFAAWAREAAASSDPLFFAICDRDRGPSGVCSYLRIAPAQGTIEIGNIWLALAIQRTAAATEAIFLLAGEAFDSLGYRRLEWKCDSLNAASRRAADRLGFTFEGVFLQHMIVKGRNRDTAWYALLDRDWPVAKRAFELWLAPENFDADGNQRRRLSDLRAELRHAPVGDAGSRGEPP